MSLMVPESKLRDAHKALMHTWWREGERWRDEPHRRMGEQVIDPTDHAVQAASAAMENMGEALAKARAACE